MPSKKPAQLTDEELIKQDKTLKAIVSLVFGAMGVLIAANLILLFRKGFSALQVIPVALLPIVLLLAGSRKEVKNEMEKRGLRS